MPPRNPALATARRWTVATMAVATLATGAAVVELHHSASAQATSTTSTQATSTQADATNGASTTGTAQVVAGQGSPHASTSGS